MERLHPEISPGPELDHLEEFWTSRDELEYDISFDRSIFVDEKPKKPKLKEKPLVLPPVKQLPVERKHISRSGKK
jgi:hypothetical protein